MEKLAMCLIVLSFVASAGCAEPAEAPQAAVITGLSEAEDIAAIRDLRLNRFAASFIGADTDGFLASITEDMVIMPPDEPRVSGHDAIRAWLDAFFAAYKTDLEYTGSDVSLAGDVAFETYTFRWTLTPLAGGEEIRQAGKGVYVFRRQADGSWRVARDIWNYTPEG
jgi:uncharacterized protein (TIGR02246 family)